LKRLELVIEALRAVRSPARLIIAGTGPLHDQLASHIERQGLSDRVRLLGFVDAEDLVRLYAGCRAAYYGPVNEDYGYVTVEAFLSGKPVITTNDAGGPLEFVTDEETGYVTTADPERIAATIDRLWDLPETRLREMGENGRRRVQGIGWDLVVDRLTETIR
jgi:glycosyltransferase involved in cell wall biosynthesis